MSRNSFRKPAPHPLVAALAITAMSLLVAGMLELVGLLEGMNSAVASWFAGLGLGGKPRPLDTFWVWVWTGVATSALAWAVLHVGRPWQRWVLVISTVVLSLAWVPVLMLLGRTAPPGLPVVALLWVSIGSLVYAARHRTRR